MPRDMEVRAMRKIKLLAIAVGAVIGTGAWFYGLSVIGPRITAAYWRQQLAAAPDEGVETVIRRIGELDRAGIAVLAAALGSERECVAQAAKQELFAELEQWRRLSAGENASRLTELASALAERVDGFNPAGQRDAADVAVRILDRPLKGRGVDARELLAASEKVLRVGFSARGEFSRIKRAELAGPAVLAKEESINAAELPGAGSPESSGQEMGGLSTVSGDGMPGKLKSPSAESGEEESQTADAAANQPWILGRQDGSRQRASRIPDSAAAGVDASRGAMGGKQTAGSGTVRTAANIAGGEGNRRIPSALAGEEAVELIRELNSEDDARAEAAEAELIGRGFTEAQLELARKLFDPDPAVRKKLVRELPGLEGVDTAPWLLELCRDADAEVRLAAIALLATSSDPAVLDEVERIAGRDEDSGIRRIADRIGQQRNARR
jgi:hypothetical protein